MWYAVKLSMLVIIAALFVFHFSRTNQPGRCDASRQHAKVYTVGAVDEAGHAYPIKGFNPSDKNWKLVFSLSDGRTVEGRDKFLLNLIKLIKFRCVDGGDSTPMHLSKLLITEAVFIGAVYLLIMVYKIDNMDYFSR